VRTSSPAALLALLALSSMSSWTAASEGDDKTIREIKHLRDQWVEAEETKDIPFLDQLLADDVVIGNSQGQILTKPEFLDRMRSPGRTLKILNTRDVVVRLYGTVAILTEQITVDGLDNGHPFGGEFRFIRIFARQHGKWRVVLGQGTPIKPPQANSD
jgi:ketosteroid isomerase-like protein